MFNKQDTELSTCTSTTAISDVIGGLASFILNYFKMKFPENLFKETYISNSLNSNVLARGIAHNQKLPYIGMEMEFTDETSLMGTTPRDHYPQQFIAKKSRDKYYRLIFEDLDSDVKIYAMPKRLRVRFNFLLKFQTHMAAIDWVHYLNNHFEPEGANFINGIRLPVEIPRHFIDRIRTKLDLNPHDAEDNETLRHYLRDNSLGGIRYVMNPTTGNNSYMLEYVTNILLQYPDVPTMDVNETGLVVRDSNVTFSIDTEISSPSGFILEVRDGHINTNLPPIDMGKDGYVLNYYIVTDKIPNQLNNGKRMIDMANFITEVNSGIDELDIKEILSQDLRQTIEAIDKVDNFDISKLFEYKLYANNLLVDDEKYEVGFDDHILINYFPESNVTYTLVLYGDIRKLNDINELILTNNRHKIKPLLYSYM